MPPAAPIALSTLAIQAGIGFGLSAVSFAVQNFVLKDKGTFGNSNERNFQANGTSTETYLPVIYGKAKIGINRVFIDTDPENKDWLYVVGSFAHGTINRIKKIYADDEVIAVYNEKKKKWVVDDEYTGLVGTIQVNRGSDNAKHFSFVGDKFDAWSDDKRGRGVASIAFALKADNDKFPGGIPNITLIAKGNAQCYDTRDGTKKYTDNFALCYLDALRNKRYGNAVPDNEVDFDNFSAMANYCDEWIEGDPIEAATKCKPKIKSMDCKLEKNGVYNYKVCAVSAWTYSEPDFQGQTVSSSTTLSSSSQVTVTTKKGRVSLTITPSATNKENVDKFEIYRTKANGSTYYLVKEIDYDSDDTEQELTIIDNLSDVDLEINKLYDGNGWGDDDAAGVPSIVATYTAYSSDLDLQKYYRYKIVYGKSSTAQYVQGGVRSKAIKTKKGKKFIRLNSIPTSDDNGVDVRVIYRTEGMDNATDDEDDNSNYKYLYTIDDNDETEEYLDTLADGSLGSVGGADSNPYGFPATCPSVATLTSGQQRRHTVNGIMDTSKTVLQNLEEMLMGAVAKSHFEGGKWRLDIKRPTVAEQITINRDNVIRDWTFNLPGADTLCNYVKAAFINPKANYQTDYVVFPPKRNLNQYLIDDNRFENVKEIDLPYINDRRKAQIMAMITRGLSRQGITATLKVKEELLKVRVGSVVKAELDTPGWDGKKFWVEGFSVGMDFTNYITLQEYNADAFDRQYLEADAPDDTDTNLPDATEPPDEVAGVVIVEQEYLDNYSTNWRLKVTFTNPDSPFWSHSDVYVKRGDDAEYTYDQKISRDNEGIFYIQPIEAFTTYYLQILSVSTLGVSMHLNNEDDVVDDWEATVWPYEVEIDPPAWKDFGIELLGRSGNNGVAYGPDFVFRWKPYGGSKTGNQISSSRNSLGLTKTAGHTYYVQIYHDYPSTVVIGGMNISTTLATSFFTSETICRYTFSDNVENSKTLFEGILKESSSGTIEWNGKTYAVNTNVKNAQTYYDQYWGKGYSGIRVKVSVIDEYNQMSASSEEITFTNPRPLMQLEITSGLGVKSKVNISLIDSLNKGGSILNTKSGAEVSFQHPDKEYDITHFYLKYFRIGEWFANCAYTAKDLILVNNKVYYCYQSGTSGGTIPSELSNGSTGGTYTDGTAKWQDGESYITPAFEDTGDLLYTTKITSSTRINVYQETAPNTEMIMSMVNVNSSDDDVENAYYCKEIKQLDPKYYYLIGVVPLDVFGKTVAVANYAWGWAKPGLTDDDDGNEIEAPATPTFTGITASDILKAYPTTIQDGSTITRLTLKCNKNSETDIKEYIYNFIGIAKSGETVVPTASEIETGYKTISAVNYEVSLKETKVEYVGSSDTYVQGHLRGAETGWTYFAKVRAVNSSGLKSDFTAIGANQTESIAGDTTAPKKPTSVTIATNGSVLKVTVSTTSPDYDLAGYVLSIKAGTSFTNDADRTSNIKTSVEATQGSPSVTYEWTGTAGVTYIASAYSYDKTGNVLSSNAWTDSTTQKIAGYSDDHVSKAYARAKYSGTVTATSKNSISVSSGTLSVKKRGVSAETFSMNTLNVTGISGVRYIFFDEDTSTTTWQSGTQTQLDTYPDAIILAKVENVTDGNANITMYLGTDSYSTSAWSVAANQMSAWSADFGYITAGRMSMQHDSGAYIKMLDNSSYVRLYQAVVNGGDPVIKISKSGYHANTETNPDNLIFSTEYNYFKILQSGSYSMSLTADVVTAGTSASDTTVIGNISSGAKNSPIFAYIKLGSWVVPLPYDLTGYYTSNPLHKENWRVDYAGVDGGNIRFIRQVSNADSSDWTLDAWNFTIYWYIMAQTIGD